MKLKMLILLVLPLLMHSSLIAREDQQAEIKNRADEKPAVISETDNISPENIESAIKKIIASHNKDNTGELLEAACKISPFHTAGKIHSLMIQHLIASGIYSRQYCEFLMDAIINENELNSSTNIYMVMDIIQYLASDDMIDETEWEIILMSIKKTGSLDISDSLLRESICPLVKSGMITRAFRRIDQYFDAMAGLSEDNDALKGQEIFYKMFTALVSVSSELKEYDTAVYCFKNYSFLISEDKEQYYRPIKNMYLQAESDDDRNRLLELIIDYCNSLEVHEKNARNIMDFYSACILDKALQQDKSLIEKRELELERFTIICREALSRNLALLAHTSLHKEAALFCISYNIPCPELIPATSDIYSMLLSDDVQSLLAGLDYCIAMKKTGSEFLPVINGLIRLFEFKPEQNSPEVLVKGIDYLIAVQADDKDSLSLLTGLLKSSNYPVNHYAKKALRSIKSPAVTTHLIKTLNHEDDYIRMQVISILKETGAVNDEARAMLQTIASSPGNKWLIAEARQALTAK